MSYGAQPMGAAGTLAPLIPFSLAFRDTGKEHPNWYLKRRNPNQYHCAHQHSQHTCWLSQYYHLNQRCPKQPQPQIPSLAPKLYHVCLIPF